MKQLRFRFILLFALLIITVLFVQGCSKKIKAGIDMQPEAKWKQIAVLPVVDKTGESQAAQIMRTEMIDELFFKGYVKILPETIDEKLTNFYKKGVSVQPQVVGDNLGVDAVLYCTLSEWKKSAMLAYSSMSIKADFELKSAKGGEVLWKESKTVVKRNFHPLKREIRELTLMDYEPAVQELVTNAIASLPNGPNFVAKGPLKKGALQEWF